MSIGKATETSAGTFSEDLKSSRSASSIPVPPPGGAWGGSSSVPGGASLSEPGPGGGTGSEGGLEAGLGSAGSVGVSAGPPGVDGGIGGGWPSPFEAWPSPCGAWPSPGAPAGGVSSEDFVSRPLPSNTEISSIAQAVRRAKNRQIRMARRPKLELRKCIIKLTQYRSCYSTPFHEYNKNPRAF